MAIRSLTALLLTAALAVGGCATVQTLEVEYRRDSDRSLAEALADALKARNLKQIPTSSRGKVQGIGEFPRWADDKPSEPQVSASEESPTSEPKHPPKPTILELPGGETVVSRGPGTPLLLYGRTCMRGHSCGCDRQMEYFAATDPSGRLFILRPEPTTHVDTITRWGSCASGCGQPSGDLPYQVYELPTVTDISRVSIVSVPFDLYLVDEDCWFPTNAP
jgi:hypothetical protein